MTNCYCKLHKRAKEVIGKGQDKDGQYQIIRYTCPKCGKVETLNIYWM